MAPGGVEWRRIRSFELSWISASAPRSYSISPAQGIALVAFADGGIVEVSDAGARQVIVPWPFAVGQQGFYGIALVPPLNMFVSLYNSMPNGFDFYTLAGELVALITTNGGARYNGVFSEEREASATCSWASAARAMRRARETDAELPSPEESVPYCPERGCELSRLSHRASGRC
jgi:hypothetical protein